jgi:hypothetical protein
MQGVSDADSPLSKGRHGSSQGDDAHRRSGKDQIDMPSQCPVCVVECLQHEEAKRVFVAGFWGGGLLVTGERKEKDLGGNQCMHALV